MTTEKNPDFDRSAAAGGAQPQEVGHVDSWDSLAIDLLEGTLPAHVAAPLEAHVAGCADCRRVLAEQRSMATLLAEVPEVTVPPALGRAVLEGSAGFVASEPAATTRRETSRGRMTGTLQSLRRMLNLRVLLPAAAVILVAGVALSAYDRVGLGARQEGADTLATEAAQKDTSDATAAALGSEAGEDGAMQAAPDGSRESAGGAPETSTTTAGATSTTTAGAAIMAAPTPVVIMTVGDAGEDADSLAQRVKDLTGLEPLPRDSWVEGRTTYAALIAADQSTVLAAELGVTVSESLPSAEYAVNIPPALADSLGPEALTTLPLLTPQAADTSSTGQTWRPSRDAAQRAGDADLTIVVITLGAGPVR